MGMKIVPVIVFCSLLFICSDRNIRISGATSVSERVKEGVSVKLATGGGARGGSFGGVGGISRGGLVGGGVGGIGSGGGSSSSSSKGASGGYRDSTWKPGYVPKYTGTGGLPAHGNHKHNAAVRRTSSVALTSLFATITILLLPNFS